ncbi:FecR domain-containing protein [Pedobacter sp. AW31-3R]|uniref:FecR domain-containing protein n=1 Tax=Pedobacter sp. AW31-3R TaxID=3445781 RepID=UPI003F9FEA29
MTETEVKNLLNRYRDGKATAEEVAFLNSWAMTYRETGEEVLSMQERVQDLDEVWGNLNLTVSVDQPTPGRTWRLWLRTAAAILTLIGFSFGTYLLLKQDVSPITELQVKNDLQPGANKATLTLADGRKIVLGEKNAGQVLAESGISISKTSKGELIYKAIPSTGNPGTVQFNELSTYQGEQYQLILPDQTHVWLNAASSIRYPVVFSGNERRVELKGEAYFEVAHDRRKPFRVKTEKQTVEVLGTHFNVNAYADEPLWKTTLEEGSVRILTPSLERVQEGEIILKPGQQSVLLENKLSVAEANLEEAMAWKNGYFMFEGEHIKSIMRKISRWYNVEIVYEGEIPDDQFGGTVSRFSNVSQVLKKLELTGRVHFKVEGRRITVKK